MDAGKESVREIEAALSERGGVEKGGARRGRHREGSDRILYTQKMTLTVL